MIWQDVRYGIRVLAKSPGFTAVAVVTLALGIGLNTALFSVVNAVLVQNLPYRDADRLVQLREVHGNRTPRVSRLSLRDWREQNRTFDEIAGYQDFPVNVAGGTAPVRTRAALVTETFFDVLGSQPSLGRVFLPSDQSPMTAVLSHSLWEKEFGADPAVLGKVIRMDGLSLTVLGVMPPSFDFPARTELWIPRDVFPDHSTRSAHNYSAIGRLKSGSSVAAAQSDLRAVSAAIASRDRSDGDFSARVLPLHDALTGSVRPAFLVLLGAVGFVLLIACVNVASLQLARAGARSREIALRTALGAKRSRLIRQLLTENLLLAFIGGVAGLLLALWSTDLLRSFVPPEIPRIGEIRIDPRVLWFTAGLTALAGILFGLLPAISVSAVPVNEALRHASRRHRTGGILAASEIALAMILLTGAALLMQSFWRLQSVDPGFRTAHVWSTAISWPSTARSAAEENGDDILLYRRLFERLRRLPGVEAVAATSSLPISELGADGLFEIEGRPKDPKLILDSSYRVVTPDYFRVLGIPLVRGRVFTDHDDAGNPWVAAINEAMARQFFAGEDPVGKRIRFYGFDPKPQWLTVSGVVGNSRDYGVNAAVPPICFTHYLQHPGDLRASSLVVLTAQDDARAIAAAVRAVHQDVPVKVGRMTEVISASIARERFQMQLLLVFALTALLLAAVGIYGVLSYSVERRSGELGIRMALGARPARILRQVLVEGLFLAALGVGFGAAGTLALTRTLRSFLFGISATDPLTLALTTLVLAAVAVLASYLPARRATQIDPAAALRNE